MRKWLSFFVVFNTLIAWSQSEQRILLHAKVVSDTTSTEGINVLNIVSEQSTITNQNGEFYIYVKEDDLLLLTAVNFEIKRKLIDKEDLKNEIIKIKMIPKTIELKEVKINENPQVNAVDLGIISKDIKRYTPAERRLYTATTSGGGLPLDPLLNWISGRTAMLKKELVVEKKERLLLKLDGQFEDDYYINDLKIPQEYIKGFQYYIIEDGEFVSALTDKNKTLMKYLLPRLAINYNQLTFYEK